MPVRVRKSTTMCLIIESETRTCSPESFIHAAKCTLAVILRSQRVFRNAKILSNAYTSMQGLECFVFQNGKP